MSGAFMKSILLAVALAVVATTRATATPVLTTYITVDGTALSAWIDLPPGHAPQTLVMFCHGHHETKDAFLVHMNALRVADTGQTLAMAATDYRDDQGFPVLRGAQDVLALSQQLRSMYPSITRVALFGVSMGGGICGTAASEAGRAGTPIAALFSLEGVTELQQTYTEAQAAGLLLGLLDPSVGQGLTQTATEIDRDIAAAPEPNGNRAAAFTRRSPAMNGSNLAATGMQGAVNVQGVFDGTVPDNQSLELAAALHAVSDPTVTVEALLGSPGTASGDTLLTDLQLASVIDVDMFFTLVGHGYTGDPTQPVIYQGMCRLQGWLAGTYTLQERFVVVSYPLNNQSCP
jgi:pimeloyl-ACP methyl ester carboxylesterase